MRITLLGMCGSGKTTLANSLCTMLNTMCIESGAIARANGFAGSKEEKEGRLADNETEIRRLIKEAVAGSNKYVIDGFPRTLDQAKSNIIDIDCVVYLNMLGKEDTAIERLLARGRPDDTEEIIHKRINTYYTHTAPLVDYYEGKEMLLRINATGTMAQTLSQTMVGLCNRNLLAAKEYVENILKKLNSPHAKIHSK